jgi:uncharacterized protein
MKVLFNSADHYQPVKPPNGYWLLPFRFMRWQDDDVLVTNDGGEFIFLDNSSFTQLCGGQLPPSARAYGDLKAKQFLTDSESSLPLELLATKFRTKKDFLAGFTKLHLFVVTLRCDHSCAYCQVSRVTQDRLSFDMSRETAERAVDLMFRSPSPSLKVEFQGGESLLNFDLVAWCVGRISERNQIEGRHIEFVIATNLAPLTDEILRFCADHQIILSTSLDGPAFIHNANRPRPGGDSYEVATRNITKAREVLGPHSVSALMTTTALSLQHPIAIVDEYVRQGFGSIFLRSISPYGFAVRGRQAGGYQSDRFLAFYRTALEYIIALNREGIALTEVFSQILLQKILTPFATGYVDLQSPAGAGIGVVAYNFDGDVYASDESRMLAQMGDHSFRLGNVHRHSYEELFAGEVVRGLVESSCAETLPGCSECAFVPFCGADPVFNWATQGDPVGHRPTSAFCEKNMGVFRVLFELLKNGDDFTKRLLLSWATDRPARAA